MAHGEGKLNVHQGESDVKLHYTIVQGKDVTAGTDAAISIEELMIAPENISLLSHPND